MLRALRLARFAAVSAAMAIALRASAPAVRAERRARHRARFVRAWARVTLSALSIRADVRGRPPSGPCLYVSNHLGYLDVPVLSSALSAAFVSKDDVRRWPLVGFLARTSGAVFLPRESGFRAVAALEEMRARLRAGESVLVFPEGTSSRGGTVLPFRSFPFAAADAAPEPTVVPVRIDLLEVGGKPAEGPLRDLACWHGDMDFAGHFWRFLGSGGARYRVSIGEPLPAGTGCRKRLARIARERICAMDGMC